ncbi:hypothetical protein TWF106_007108 [Orbilia oligospora]|uniref:F-box domain-containing protein n=1 Tax=Orbilia oligospora TaxID=2813651 RepID=A0A6G1M3F6_ORBOL|nr:hypothetical protein TWF788_009897 [Orbilia oligospora]KAF3207879.1 hypothetical protein TWF679_008211 [Orbilia oligospora]KAF3219267.1 hypothetical protein TWF106_007108 [Orbilia oligospora]KAF3220506.1 hypothetical protein TWF191_007405 [Orbilia oligospora]KAF3244082.1 hypothetical protein TWF192_007888 [Orbilia oligospora]
MDDKKINPYLPLELQLLILEAAPFESHQTLSLVCRTWRTFILTSPSVLKNRYTSYTLPEGHANGPRTKFHEPLYHGILSYLTHYVRMDDGIYHACYLKPPGYLNWTGEPVKYILNPGLFGKDLLSLDHSPDEKGKGKSRDDDLQLNFNNIYAHERIKPWKQSVWKRPFPTQASATPTIAEFLKKNGQAVNNGLADYYTNYSYADVLKVVMKYTRDSSGVCFLEFALAPLPRSSENVNSTTARERLDLEEGRGRTKGLIRKWEVVRKLKGMVKRKSKDPDARVEPEALEPGLEGHYEGKEVKSFWRADGVNAASSWY